jgi:hypothetical protein
MTLASLLLSGNHDTLASGNTVTGDKLHISSSTHISHGDFNPLTGSGRIADGVSTKNWFDSCM